MNDIAKRISDIIEDSDRSRTELAEYLGVNRREINRWEKGESEMGITKLQGFCKYFGVSADYILNLERGLQWPRR